MAPAITPNVHITNLTLVDNLGGGNYSASFKAVSTSGSTVRLSYFWRILGTAEWNPATVVGPTTVVGTALGASVSAVFNLDASDNFSGNTEESIEFRVEAYVDGQTATASLQLQSGSQYSEGDFFTVLDRTYEFTTDGDHATGHVPVLISGNETASDVAAAVAEAINDDAKANATATVNGSTVSLTAKEAGESFNVAVTVYDANQGTGSANVLVSGFAGGASAAGAEAEVVFLNAATNAIGEAPVVENEQPQYRSGKVVQFFTLNQQGARPSDHITQGWGKKSIAYKMIDLLRSGANAKFDLVPDHYGLDLRRGVLISVEEWNRVRGTESLTIELKSKQWFAWYANKGLSRPSFFENNTKVYALFESKIINGRTYQNVVAYLVSDETYKSLSSASSPFTKP